MMEIEGASSAVERQQPLLALLLRLREVLLGLRHLPGAQPFHQPAERRLPLGPLPELPLPVELRVPDNRPA